jgi:hypothetical protein
MRSPSINFILSPLNVYGEEVFKKLLDEEVEEQCGVKVCGCGIDHPIALSWCVGVERE